MIELLSFAENQLAQGNEIVLATICKHGGSTPREAGACMIVLPDGTITGTIGGGLVEAATIKAAQKLLKEGTPAAMRSFDLDNSQAAQSGMICGGNLEVGLQCFAPGEPAVAFFKAAHQNLRQGKPVTMVCELDGKTPSRTLLADGIPAAGKDEFTPEALQKALAALDESPMLAVPETANGPVLVLPIQVPETAVLIGAGHVSLFTARVLAMVGFRTVVLDDREEFANRERFPEAAEVIVSDGFESCLEPLGINRSGFVVIFTRGHLHDKTVLQQALATPAAYIGMIGSKKKRDATYDALRKEGVTDENIARVHCPIGLSIDAQTPEEIAVAIAGEMIQARAAYRNGAPHA